MKELLKGKKTHIQSDFKRVKAKVGKRAPQKINATETEFRTASVQVRAQNIVESDNKRSKNTSTAESSSQLDVKGWSTELTSSRGRTLSYFLTQLHHHAPAVRASALQGIKDAIAISSNSIIAILANISLLMPALSKCLVDDDKKVRSLALLNLNDLTNTMVNSDSVEVMEPFLPLTMAYITSALNSLDEDIRFDGCTAVEMFCTRFALVLHSDDNRVNAKILHSILPPFVRLLMDVGEGHGSVLSNRGSIGNNSSKSKKRRNVRSGQGTNSTDSSSNMDRATTVLRSLSALLQTVTSFDESLSSSLSTLEYNCHEYDLIAPANGPSLLPSTFPEHLTFLPGGRTTNAILFNRLSSSSHHGYQSCAQYGTIATMKSITSLNVNLTYSMSDENYDAVSSSLQSTIFSIKAQTDLLCRLRDRYVEVTQKGHDQNQDGGLFLSLSNIEELSLLITAIRLLWNGFCRWEVIEYSIHIEQYNKKLKRENVVNATDDGNFLERKKLSNVARLVQNLFLECFPIKDDSGNVNNKRQYDMVNALFCCALGEFGSVLSFVRGQNNTVPAVEYNTNSISGPSSLWVDAVFGYLLPRLKSESSSKTFLDNDVSNDSFQETTNSESTQGYPDNSTTVILIKVIGQLLLRQKTESLNTDCPGGSYLLYDKTKRMELLTKFGETFFTPELLFKNPDDNNDEKVIIGGAHDNDPTFLKHSNCLSTSGRKAAMLLTSLIREYFEQISIQNTSIPIQDPRESNLSTDAPPEVRNYGELVKLAQMASILPAYLYAWQGSFPNETNIVLATLLSMVRRCEFGPLKHKDKSDIKANDESFPGEIIKDLGDSLRLSIEKIFVSSTKKKKRKDCSKSSATMNHSLSIFEQYSETTQRLIMSLVGLLQYPTETLVKNLTQICARCSRISSVQLLQSQRLDERAHANELDTPLYVSGEMTDYMISVMHSMRRTMNMGSYLSFLVHSIGITSNVMKDYVAFDLIKKSGKQKEEISADNKKRKVVNSSPDVVDNCENINAENKKRLAEAEIKNIREMRNDNKISVDKSPILQGSKVETTLDANFIICYDKALARSCRYLTQCGRSKIVLAMLKPILFQWIESSAKNVSLDNRSKDKNVLKRPNARIFDMLRARAAMAIISSCAVNEFIDTPMSFQNPDHIDSYPSIFDGVSDMESQLCDTIVDLFFSMPLVRIIDSDDASKAIFLKISTPVQALLTYQPLMIIEVLDKTRKRVEHNYETDLETTEIMVVSLLVLIKSPMLFEVLRIEKVSQCLANFANFIETVLAKGPLDSLCGKFKVEVQALLGFVTVEKMIQ